MKTITYEEEYRLKQEIFKQAAAIANKYGYHLTGSATVSTGQGFRMNMHVCKQQPPRNDEKRKLARLAVSVHGTAAWYPAKEHLCCGELSTKLWPNKVKDRASIRWSNTAAPVAIFGIANLDQRDRRFYGRLLVICWAYLVVWQAIGRIRIYKKRVGNAISTLL